MTYDESLASFPWKTFIHVIDKMEYLNEEASPYEVSPGTDLCISDTYYSLGFLTYLHSFGRVTTDDEKWFLDSMGNIPIEKPHRFALIKEATEILEQLLKGPQSIAEIINSVPEFSDNKTGAYLNLLSVLSQKGKIKQISTGWDATFILTEWD